MSRYNNVEKNSTKTISYEGGTVYEKSLEDDWANMLFSFVFQVGCYEDAKQKEDKYKYYTNLMIEKYGPEFVAKAAVFARNELGIRTISELTAAMVNKYQFKGKRKFYSSYFKRPDGVGEVFAAVDDLGDKKSHALIRGAADYLSTLDEYQIGKYRMNNHKYNMYDLINITHATSLAIDKYKLDTLEMPDTWEFAINKAESQEDRDNEWLRLVYERKLPYLALIRNIRNILDCDNLTSDFIENTLYPQLVNSDSIKKSLVYPYQIYVAYKSIASICPSILKMALSEAFKISTSNVPKFDGNNAIVLDVSGSMETPYNNGDLTIKEVSAIYAIALYMSDNKFDLIKFGSDAKYCLAKKYLDSFDLIERYQENDGLGCSTELWTAFSIMTYAKESYDRIFIFSDMQVMDDASRYFYVKKSSNKAFEEYKSKTDAKNCKIFSFDLGNYSSQIVPQNSDVKYFTTVSSKVFEILKYIDNDNVKLVDIIKEYKY